MRFSKYISIVYLIVFALNASAYDQNEMIERARGVNEFSKEHLNEGSTSMNKDYYERAILVYRWSEKLLNDEEGNALQKRMANIGRSDHHMMESYFKSNQIQDTDLIVMVSFSMPDSLIKHYLEEAKRFGANVYVNGLINNDIKQTQIKMAELLGNDGKGAIQVDPNQFARFNITTVPAIILADQNSQTHYDVIMGSVPIEYALNRFADSGDMSAEAKNRLKRGKA